MSGDGLVVVTGANGFVGRCLCETLLRAGRPVRAVVRPRVAPIGAAPCVTVDDLSRRDQLRGAVGGARAVVHLAGRAHVLRETTHDVLGDFRRVNVEGTRAVLEEAIAAGAECFVFVSSVKAVRSSCDRVLDESTPAEPDTPYGVSKLEAEQLVRDVGASAGIRTTILRPPLVYGPGMQANALHLFDLVARGVPLPLGAVPNRRSLIYVENLAAAIIAAVDRGPAAREPYFVSDGDDVSTTELARAIGRALGRPARLVPVPSALIRGAARLGDVASRLVRVPLTSAAAESLLGSLAVDPSPFARDLGFVPPHSLEAGLRATADWHRSRRPARA